MTLDNKQVDLQIPCHDFFRKADALGFFHNLLFLS